MNVNASGQKWHHYPSTCRCLVKTPNLYLVIAAHLSSVLTNKARMRWLMTRTPATNECDFGLVLIGEEYD
jgi:hypothetical protein